MQPETQEIGCWIDAYLFIKNRFCQRCEFTCNHERKLLCIEQFLYITENWEIANDSKSNVRNAKE